MPERSVDKRDPNRGLVGRWRGLTSLPSSTLWGRSVYFLRQPLFRLFTGCPKVPRDIPSPLATLPDPWPGFAERGVEIAKGFFEFAGQSIAQPDSQWLPQGASADWLKEMHSFSWLRDLRAASGDNSRRTARELTTQWMDDFAKWHPLAWEPATLARRLSHWLGHYEFFASSAEPQFRKRLLTSALIQAKHLDTVLPAGRVGADRICMLKGLIIAGACLPGGDAWLTRGLRLLLEELPLQILPDGGQIERSPAKHLAVMRDLIDVKSILHAANQEIPAELQQAIETLAPVLRMYQHGDGGLALFNGSSAEEGFRIDLVLQRASGGGRPRLSAPNVGFQRIQAGRTLLIADCGQPSPRGYDGTSHAGTLSFEMSVGRERFIVNCGTGGPRNLDSDLAQALRSTAAHSTLTANDINSSLFLPALPWGQRGLAERPEEVTCRREEQEGATLLELSHDGYLERLGLIHSRRLYLSPKGDDLRGEDHLSVQGPAGGFAIRFHLHPEVQASLVHGGGSVLLKLQKGGGWRFRASGADLRLEESLYCGGGQPRRSQQIVLTGGYAVGDVSIKWALRKEGGR